MAAHKGSCDQFDDLKVLLQILDDALQADRQAGTGYHGNISLIVQQITLRVSVCLHHLVLFLIGLLDERTGDLVQLTESGNNPNCLRTALL